MMMMISLDRLKVNSNLMTSGWPLRLLLSTFMISPSILPRDSS